jgi:S-adenosylmethionine:tRNA ribosyltransferase-isomerase
MDELLNTVGEVPLPPYIHSTLEDVDDYQTVFARRPGSAAAPTAGFHFTKQLLKKIDDLSVQIETITLHIGLDTFAPLRVTDPTLHPIHSEWCQVSEETIQALVKTKAASGRVIAVGTSVVRALETVGRKPPSERKSYQDPTDLYILPGFEFKIVDAMITNFHLPRSTLLLLVSAFAGRRQILAAYEIAKKMGYRFYSFGDAMFIR